MSIYGALFAAVSGLNAQGNAIAMRSDNIVNINTVGYKSRDTHFATLVTNISSKNSYSSGGVQSSALYNIDKQGLLEATGVSTHLAVNGQGLFVVSDTEDASSGYQYTRAGSFVQDANGNLRNASGFYLLAWPLDSEGRLPGEAGNLNGDSSALLTSLQPVNIRSAANAVSATSTVGLSMNLNQEQRVLEGAGQNVRVTNIASANHGIGARDLIVPNSNVNVGSNLVVSTPIGSTTFTYGGVATSNNVSLGIFGATNASQIFTGATEGWQFTVGNSEIGTATLTYQSSNPDITGGQFNNLSTLAGALNNINGVTARVVGSRLYVGPTDANQDLNFADVGGSTLAASIGLNNIDPPYSNVTDGGRVTGNDITATILGASNTTDVFTLAPGDGISITTDSVATTNFDFVDPPVAPTDFNNLTSLAAAINTVTGLTATINDNRLYIRANNPADTITFADLSGTAVAAPLGLTNTTTTAGTVNRFNSLESLANLVNGTTELGARIQSQTSDATIKIYNNDPYSTIWYDSTYPLPGEGTFLNEFGFTTYDGTNSTTFGPAYDANGVNAGNIAGGNISAHFTRNIAVFDSFGAEHVFYLSFVKTGQNLWSVEIYAADPDDVVSNRTDGLVAAGQIRFNGDGSLRSIDNSLALPVEITFSNGSLPSNILFNWGNAGQPTGTVGATEIGDRSGLGQIASDYEVLFVDQNGVSASLLQNLEINEVGVVTARYKNGLSKDLFKIPLAEFRNPNGLSEINQNVYLSTQDAGDFNLREAKRGSVGSISAGNLEQSNVDLADELTRIVIAQRSYEAQTQIVTISNSILERLNRLFG